MRCCCATRQSADSLVLRCGLDALLASCRATTLKTALLEHLLPQLGGELRAKLLADAQQAVLGQVSDKLWEYASEAPTQVQPDAARITHCQCCKYSMSLDRQETLAGHRLQPAIALWNQASAVRQRTFVLKFRWQCSDLACAF